MEQPLMDREPIERPLRERSTVDLVRSIAGDTSTLVKKQVELAKQEVVEGVAAKARGVAAMAVAGVLGLFVIGFLGLAAAHALDLVLEPWASRLIVAGSFLLLAAIAGLLGLRVMKKRSIAPEETKRTVKEDVEWARQQLKR
jgi:nitrogen regulatory protein PII-like uncharacterized protein